MIVLLVPTVIEIGLNDAGGAVCNGAMQASMFRGRHTARLSVIHQRRCRVRRLTTNAICMQFAVCVRSLSEPKH
jgi:hypothetical protein